MAQPLAVGGLLPLEPLICSVLNTISRLCNYQVVYLGTFSHPKACSKPLVVPASDPHQLWISGLMGSLLLNLGENNAPERARYILPQSSL